MSDDYTPSLEDGRLAWSSYRHDPEWFKGQPFAGVDTGPEFDRMIAQVRAETLREARDNVRASSFWADGSDNYADRVRGYLSRAADRIEKEAGL